MVDNSMDVFKSHGRAATAAKRPEADAAEEDSCPAFGFLRGVRDRALAIEFRFANGNSEWQSYSGLASFRFNPSVGILLRFTADVVTLVLVRGSNLDLPVGEGTVNLTERGLQRHRVTFVREMDEQERKAAGKQPTIDQIEIAEFERTDDIRDWLKSHAPVFLCERII